MTLVVSEYNSQNTSAAEMFGAGTGTVYIYIYIYNVEW